MRNRRNHRDCAVALLLAGVLVLPVAAKTKDAKKKSTNSLQDYITKLSPVTIPPPSASPTGSVFTTSGLLLEPCADVRAHKVGDTISVHVVESTVVAQSATTAGSRAFTHTSGVTGVGGLTPSFLNPLLAANSTTTLKATGQADSTNTLNTTLTALVVATLPSGLLVVEAHRQIGANEQHQEVTLRGVVRPDDITSGNIVYSYQLYNLELDVKGKGIVSDSTRQPNIVMRTLLRIIGM